MSEVIAQLSVSLDEYLAGPDSGREHPLGIGGERLGGRPAGGVDRPPRRGGHVVDELWLHIVPVFLGGGRRLFDNVAEKQTEWRKTQVLDSPDATHIRLRPA